MSFPHGISPERSEPKASGVEGLVSIVEMIPLRPMPRRMGVFDYADEAGTAAVGDMMEITLRGRAVPALVAGTRRQEPDRALLPVGRPLAKAYVAPEELAFFKALADALVQSPASILAAALPRPPKRETASRAGGIAPLPLTLPSNEADAVRQTARSLAGMKRAFVCAPDVRRTAALAAAFLDAQPEARLVLIAPNLRDARLLAAHLGRFSPAFVSGEETNNARFHAWQAARRGETRLLVGTRLAALLPVRATDIWLARAGHENHRNADQNPRYDARQAARAWGARGARVVFCDVRPRPEDVAVFPAVLDPFPRAKTVFAHRAQERREGRHPMLGPTILERLAQSRAAGRASLCLCNRVGSAAGIRCRDCGFDFPCPHCGTVRAVTDAGLRCRTCGGEETSPVQCPQCQSFRMERRGWGNQAVAQALRDALPGARVAVSEKGAAPADADILVATRHYLENVFDAFGPPRVGLVALLDADAPLRAPDFRAADRALREAAEWQGLARACGAAFVVQTADPAFFRRGLGDPTAWAREELANRRAYGLPPASALVRLTCRARPAARARQMRDDLVAGARAAFPSVRAATELRSPPGTFAAELRFPPADTSAVLAWLRRAPDACIIDAFD